MAARQRASVEEEALRAVFPQLVEEVRATDIIDQLYQRNLLEKNEYKGIADALPKDDSNCKALTRRVLMAVASRPSGFVPALVEVLREKYRSLAAALEKALADAKQSVTVLASQVLERHEKEFFEVVDAKVDLFWLLRKKVITESLKVQIESSDNKNAKEILFHHLHRNADVGALREYCKMAVAADGFPNMQQLGEKMLSELPPEALPDTGLTPLQGESLAAPSANAPGPSREGGIPSEQPGHAAPHSTSLSQRDMCWPEFTALQHEFSTIVSKLYEVLSVLTPAHFDSLLFYLRERLKATVNGCLPTGQPADLPKGTVSPSALLQHLQNRWDYLNMDLIEDIIQHICEGILQHVSFTASSLQSLMTKYKENVCSKVTRTLKECKRKKVKLSAPPNYTTMAFEMNPGGSPLSFHLRQILDLKDVLVRRFGVSGALFAGWSEGSIVLYFFIPEEAVYSLCPKLESDCASLQRLHVTTVVVFGHFSVDVGYQQMSLLHKGLVSQVLSLEEEVVQLRQKLKASELNREELSAEVRGYRKAKMEPGEEAVELKQEVTKLELSVDEPSAVKRERQSVVKSETDWSKDEEEEEPAQKKGRREEGEMRFMEPMGEVQDPPHQGEKMEGEGEVWSEPASPYSTPYPGPLTPSFFPPPSPYAYLDPPLEVAPPPLLYPPTFGMGPWPPAQLAPPRVSLLPSLSPPVFSGAGQHTLQTPSTQHTAQMGPSQYGQLQSVQSTASRTTQEVCSPASGSEVFQTSQLLEDQPTLHSVRLPDLPIATAYATALVIARNVYVCGGTCPGSDATLDRVVQVYDLDKATWTKLPPAPQYNSEAAAINNQLVLIGGCEASSGTTTNMVSTWTGHGWQQDIPAMPTKRLRPGVTTYNTYLIVAGGRAEDNQTLLGSIDVMDTTTQQWYTPANLQLPWPMYAMQITVSATHISVASASIAYNATTNTHTTSNRAWQLPVSTLSKVLVGEDSGPHQLTEIARTPHYKSTLLQDTAHPLAVGGGDDSYKSNTDIAVYDRHSNKWSTVGQLLEPRNRCTAVSLSRRSFLVCGGLSDPRNINTKLSSVEVVSVQ